MEEIWKDIPGYEGLYQASTLGRIRSLDRKHFLKTKNYCRKVKGIILKQTDNGYGYLHVHLSNKGICKQIYIHRLVALTFLDNTYNKKTINHIDGNKKNNNINNLEWNTYSENLKHAFKTGLNISSKYWTGRIGNEHCKSIPIL